MRYGMQYLYGEAGLGGQAKLLLEVDQPRRGVVHHILMPHTDALLPRLHATQIPHATIQLAQECVSSCGLANRLCVLCMVSAS